MKKKKKSIYTIAKNWKLVQKESHQILGIFSKISIIKKRDFSQKQNFIHFNKNMEKITWSSTSLDKYFDENTMSLHIKANCATLVKKGKPGEWKPVIWEVMTKKDVEKLIDNIFKELESRDDGVLEIDRQYSKVVQLGAYRIVIVYKPLADDIEITAVKPTVKLWIEDYKLEKETLDLLQNQAKGILISGAPGSGKTTFAQALVDVYHKDSQIIKTIESPRDLLLPDEIVQYSFTYGSHDEIRDILLLSRPDFTVYDEVRNKNDFDLYKDLRLTGIGLVGVIHATKPIDSIQRFLGNIEMGIIPQVIDTVIYIEKGVVNEIYQLKLTVKVPEGMMSAELSRPVIQITSFFSKKIVYEIYTFGEQIVVVPMDKIAINPEQNKLFEYAQASVENQLKQYLDFDFIAKITGNNNVSIYIPETKKAGIIWKGGTNITKLEKDLGMKIKVYTMDEVPFIEKDLVQLAQDGNILKIGIPEVYKNKWIKIISGNTVINGRSNENAIISIKKREIIKSINKTWFRVVDMNSIK